MARGVPFRVIVAWPVWLAVKVNVLVPAGAVMVKVRLANENPGRALMVIVKGCVVELPVSSVVFTRML